MHENWQNQFKLEQKDAFAALVVRQRNELFEVLCGDLLREEGDNVFDAVLLGDEHVERLTWEIQFLRFTGAY